MLTSIWSLAHNTEHSQVESCLGRGAEVGALDGADDVGVAVDEPHELFKTPEAALAHAKQALGQVVVERLQLGLDVGEDRSGQLDDGDDQRSERDGSLSRATTNSN